jgi:hypothetical protein
MGRWREKIIKGQKAVAVPGEPLQDGRGVGHFVGVNDAVAIGVQGGEDWRRRGAMAAAAKVAGGSPLVARRALGPGIGSAHFLGHKCACRHAE